MNKVPEKKKPNILKRNPLGVQAETISKVASQIAAAESATTQEYDIRKVSLADISMWEEQPRKFHLTVEDIFKGQIEESDGLYKIKNEELEAIISMAMSIKEFGIINPPLAYALPGKKVQLMGGQRRTMAAIFALFHLQTIVGENDFSYHEISINSNPDLSKLESERITVKVFLRKPNELTLEKLGIIDNAQRTELPIGDKLRWVIKFSDLQEKKGREVSWRDMVDTLGLSRSQAYEWLVVIQSREDGYVKQVIEKVIHGTVTFARLVEIGKADPSVRRILFDQWFGVRPVPDRKPRISLGKTSNLNAIRQLVLKNTEGEIREHLASVDWNNPKNAKKGFSEFIEYWEKIHG